MNMNRVKRDKRYLQDIKSLVTDLRNWESI